MADQSIRSHKFILTYNKSLNNTDAGEPKIYNDLKAIVDLLNNDIEENNNKEETEKIDPIKILDVSYIGDYVLIFDLEIEEDCLDGFLYSTLDYMADKYDEMPHTISLISYSEELMHMYRSHPN